MFVLSRWSNLALALELGVLCSISKSPSKLLSKSWLGLALAISALSLSRYPYTTTYWHVHTRYIRYSQVCCTQHLTLSLQYFGRVGPAISTRPFGKTSCQRALYSSTSQTWCSLPHLDMLVGSLGYHQSGKICVVEMKGMVPHGMHSATTSRG